MNFKVGEIIYIDREKHDVRDSLFISGYYMIVKVDDSGDRIIITDRNCSINRPGIEKVIYTEINMSAFVFKVSA